MHILFEQKLYQESKYTEESLSETYSNILWVNLKQHFNYILYNVYRLIMPAGVILDYYRRITHVWDKLVEWIIEYGIS